MSLTTLPDRATFIRDRLAEWCDGYGHSVGCLTYHDGAPALEVEALSGAYLMVAVQPDGDLRDVSTYDTPQRITFAGFVWAAEPADTGHVHGPFGPGGPTFCGQPVTGLGWDASASTLYPLAPDAEPFTPDAPCARSL